LSITPYIVPDWGRGKLIDTSISMPASARMALEPCCQWNAISANELSGIVPVMEYCDCPSDAKELLDQ
jgi:hypothetical protein